MKEGKSMNDKLKTLGDAEIKMICKEMGIDYQRKMKVICQDLDWLAVYMTYIQISLLGIDGIVAQGDTLTDPYNPGRKFDERRILRTPRNTGALL